MVNVNYGTLVSEETKSQIVKLLSGNGFIFNTGISKDIILEMISNPGEKVMHISCGSSIDEASRNLPDNQEEHICEAAVLIKVNSGYQFAVTDLTNLLRYFDSYPRDPKITWSYTLDSDQEEPVTIIIFKIIEIK